MEEFKETLLEAVNGCMRNLCPNEPAYVEVTESDNGLLLSVSLDGEQGVLKMQYSLNDMYHDYKRGISLGLIVGNIMSAIMERKEEANDAVTKFEQLLNSGEIVERIVFYVKNTRECKDYLAHVPHRNIFDTSIMYRVLLDVNEQGMSSFVLTHQQAAKLHLCETELFGLALENTEQLLTTQIHACSDMMGRFVGLSADDFQEDICGESNKMFDMYIIGNTVGLYGASQLFFGKSVDNLANFLGDDLYIIPSSIHEILAVAASVADADIFADTIIGVNQNDLKRDEILSWNCYHYNREEKTLTVAAGPDAEQPCRQEIDLTDPYNPVFKLNGLMILPESAVERLIDNGGLTGYYAIYPDGTESMIEDGYSAEDIRQKQQNGVQFGCDAV